MSVGHESWLWPPAFTPHPRAPCLAASRVSAADRIGRYPCFFFFFLVSSCWLRGSMSQVLTREKGAIPDIVKLRRDREGYHAIMNKLSYYLM